MKKTYRETIDMWSLECDNDHVLHDKRQPDIVEIRQTTIKAADLEYWEELPVRMVSPYSKAEYEAKVAELVRKRYSDSEEFALQRKAINAMMHPEAVTLEESEDGTELPAAIREYNEYNDYVESCKLRAKDPGLYVNRNDN